MGRHIERGIEIAVLVRLLELRMHRREVIRLTEVVLENLPIAGHGDTQRRDPLPGFGLIALPLVAQRTEEIAQRLTLGVHIDPDKACEGLTGHLDQAQVVAWVLGEVLWVLGGREGPVNSVSPAVIRAHEFGGVTRGGEHEARPPMLTNVVERTYGAVALADHDDRLGSNLFDLIRAGIDHGILATQQQPHLRPHAFPLAAEEVCGGVPTTVELVTTDRWVVPGLGRERARVEGYLRAAAPFRHSPL